MTQLLSANSVQDAAKTSDVMPEAAFAAEYIRNGNNALAAYRAVFKPGPEQRPGTVRVDAHRMTRNPIVASLVADARKAAADALNTSVAELAMQAHELATASVGDLQRVDVYACRHCHGDGHRYQWDKPGDFEDAVEQWALVKDRVPTPRPSYGGVGFDAFAPPAPDCPHCMGAGKVVVRLVPTDELSPGARMLYAGAVTGSDGQVRMLTEDRTKWADQRNKLLGLYVARTESKSLNVNYNLQAPAQPQAPLSADDALAKLRAMGMLSPDDDSVVSEQ